jgi:hypothetical protein
MDGSTRRSTTRNRPTTDAAAKNVVPYEVSSNGTLSVKPGDVMKTSAARRQLEALAAIRNAAGKR